MTDRIECKYGDLGARGWIPLHAPDGRGAEGGKEATGDEYPNNQLPKKNDISDGMEAYDGGLP